jgi:polysaccharide biosynthesis protein PslG
MGIRIGGLCVITALLTPQAPALAQSRAVPTAGITKPVSFAVLEDYDKGTPLSRVAADFALFRELGVPVWRGSFGWDDYEPTRGRFDFTWLNRFAALADSMGITLRPYLGYTPAWSARGGADENVWNDPPRRIEDWSRFVQTLASSLRRHRSVVSFEIYNEENVPLWWDGSAGDYAQVLATGAAAARQGNPRLRVLLGGMVWPDAGWLESACDRGQSPFDVLPFHAYPETWTPDSVTVERYLGPGFQRDFLEQADRLCGRKPVWINETGFATSPGKSEEQQAQWWARAFATFLAAPRVEHLGIYEIRDQEAGTPVIGDSPNYYLGLIRRDGGKKLAFETVKLLVGLFGSDSVTVLDSMLSVRVSGGHAGKLYHHLFVRPDGRYLVFVWDGSGSPTLELELPAPVQSVTSFALSGQGSRWNDAEGRVIRSVTLQPGEVRIFETGPAGNP